MHPWVSRIFIPMNMLIMKFGKKSEKDYKNWKKKFNIAIFEFPGGINDWIAFGFFLAIIYGVFLVVLFYFDEYTMFFLKTDALFIGAIISIAAFAYYSIYFKNIDWLKERINKISKKYYLK